MDASLNLRKNKIKVGLVLLGLLLTIILIVYVTMRLVGLFYGVGVNMTNSEPMGFYSYRPIEGHIKKGEFVAFNMPPIPWILHRHYISSNEQIIKNVGAVPGQYLMTRQDSNFVCNTRGFNIGCHFLGKCLKKDEKGRTLTCQHWEDYKIPRGHYYMVSQRVKYSLDSRYFGLVRRGAMKHQVSLIWEI